MKLTKAQAKQLSKKSKLLLRSHKGVRVPSLKKVGARRR
jgi:hypothetical protein